MGACGNGAEQGNLCDLGGGCPAIGHTATSAPPEQRLVDAPRLASRRRHRVR